MDDTVAVARRAREPQDAPSMFLWPTLTDAHTEGYTARPMIDRTRPPLPPRNRAAHMEKWRGVTFLAVPGCIGLGVYLFSNHHEHHAHEQPVRHRPNWLLDPPRARATQRLSKLCVFARTPTDPVSFPHHPSGVLLHAQEAQAAPVGRRLRALRVREVPGELIVPPTL